MSMIVLHTCKCDKHYLIHVSLGEEAEREIEDMKLVAAHTGVEFRDGSRKKVIKCECGYIFDLSSYLRTGAGCRADRDKGTITSSLVIKGKSDPKRIKMLFGE